MFLLFMYVSAWPSSRPVVYVFLSLPLRISLSFSLSLSLSHSLYVYICVCVCVCACLFVVSRSMFACLRGCACLFVGIFVVRMCVKHHELNTCSCRVLFLAEEFGKDSSNEGSSQFILAMTSGTLAVVLAIIVLGLIVVIFLFRKKGNPFARLLSSLSHHHNYRSARV